MAAATISKSSVVESLESGGGGGLKSISKVLRRGQWQEWSRKVVRKSWVYQYAALGSMSRVLGMEAAMVSKVV
jgi:hypothetical protein